jgi:hypothetical protein
MRKSRFTESEIVGILKEADAGLPVGDVVDFPVKATTEK